MYGHVPPKEIGNHWRVFVAFYLVEVVGAVGASLIKIGYRDLRLTAIIAILAPIGFILGVVWQLYDPQRRQQTDPWHVAFQGVILISLAMLLWAVFGG